LANLIKLGSKVMTGHLNTVVLNDLDTFVSWDFEVRVTPLHPV
jgi:hypothetical protein